MSNQKILQRSYADDFSKIILSRHYLRKVPLDVIMMIGGTKFGSLGTPFSRLLNHTGINKNE